MDFKFPDVGEGIHEGVIVKWHVKAGDQIKKDDILCEIETDKAVVEIPSPEEGEIEKTYHEEGETVKVGETLVSYKGGDVSGVPEENPPYALRASEDKQESRIKNQGEERKEGEDQGGVVGTIVDADSSGADLSGPLFDALKKRAPSSSGGTKAVDVKVLPALRKLAVELGVDLQNVTPTGQDGSITKGDIEKAARGKGNNVSSEKEKYGNVEYEKLTPVRQTIARHLRKTFDEMISVSQTQYCNVT